MDQSPLRKTSFDVRKLIYEIIIREHRTVYIEEPDLDYEPPVISSYTHDALSFALSCKEIYHELLPLIFSNITFQVELDTHCFEASGEFLAFSNIKDTTDIVTTWLESLGNRKEFVKEMVVKMTNIDVEDGFVDGVSFVEWWHHAFTRRQLRTLVASCWGSLPLEKRCKIVLKGSVEMFAMDPDRTWAYRESTHDFEIDLSSIKTISASVDAVVRTAERDNLHPAIIVETKIWADETRDYLVSATGPITATELEMSYYYGGREWINDDGEEFADQEDWVDDMRLQAWLDHTGLQT